VVQLRREQRTSIRVTHRGRRRMTLATVLPLANIVQRGAEELSLRLGAPPNKLLAQTTEETRSMEEVHK
jgi:hypothetical protein